MPPPRVLLLIPPLTQLNTPYPATAYLTGFLLSRGYAVSQADLGIEMVLALYSRASLSQLFERVRQQSSDLPGEARQMLLQAPAYLETIEPAISFLQGRDPSLISRLAKPGFLPQGPRFARREALADDVARMGPSDCAKHLATLYLEDLADLAQATVAPHFALSRYAEHVGTSASSFDRILQALGEPTSFTDDLLLSALSAHLEREQPDVIGLSVPFPGNLYGAFRIAQAAKRLTPKARIVLGGGYVNTELRRVNDPRVFDFVDYVTLDDGERPLLCLLELFAGRRKPESLCRTFVRANGHVQFVNGASEPDVRMAEAGTPTYVGLPLDRYLSILDSANPMHRLWSDGHWNKLTVAHGCYWKKCTFCDVGLDYIGRYEPTPDRILLDRIDALIAETGRRGFHFVDEAAPPAGLKALALGLLERGLAISWWGNIRFEQSFTPDLCRLLAASGCIAVSAGLEVASDRLLRKMDKGITVDQTVRVAAAFRRAGVLVHAYLMYGFPSETIAESVDSLERVRQMFAADLIQSAFWHRFVATAHSPIGLDPNAHGITILGPPFKGFAENDLDHADRRGPLPEWLGLGLRRALANYIEGRGLRLNVQRWFDAPVRRTRVSPRWVRHALRRSETRGVTGDRHLVWLGGQSLSLASRSGTGRRRLIIPNRTDEVIVPVPPDEDLWLTTLLQAGTPEGGKKGVGYPLLSQVRRDYPFGGPKAFDAWWRGALARHLRRMGLLLV